MDGTTTVSTQIGVALQGGGAHGAFTWGVLDRLLEEPQLRISALSGASAGAMNACVAATGLVDGGPEGAREALRSFWRAVNREAKRLAPYISLIDETPNWSSATTAWMNLFQLGHVSVAPHPSNGRPAQVLLEGVVREHVDLKALRKAGAPRLFISATQVRSGQARIFTNDDLSIEAIMASACLPMAFPAVSIDDEEYWDGGYSANPPLVPLVQETSHDDVVLVTVNPLQREKVPESPAKIPDRLSEMAFNQTLVKDMRAIALLKTELDANPPVCGVPFIEAISKLRIHEIQNEDAMRTFDSKSKIFPSWELLSDLHELGHQTASHWLTRNGTSIGKTSTALLQERYL